MADRLRMFPGMTPLSQHRFLHRGTRTLVELTLPSEKPPLKERLKNLGRSILFGGEARSAHHHVDRSAFASAYELFWQSPQDAADRFKALGYDVRITELRTTP